MGKLIIMQHNARVYQQSSHSYSLFYVLVNGVIGECDTKCHYNIMFIYPPHISVGENVISVVTKIIT